MSLYDEYLRALSEPEPPMLVDGAESTFVLPPTPEGAAGHAMDAEIADSLATGAMIQLGTLRGRFVSAAGRDLPYGYYRVARIDEQRDGSRVVTVRAVATQTVTIKAP